jgi:hypothetical protein
MVDDIEYFSEVRLYSGKEKKKIRYNGRHLGLPEEKSIEKVSAHLPRSHTLYTCPENITSTYEPQ